MKNKKKKLNKKFYTVTEVDNNLNSIYKYINSINLEVNKLIDFEWLPSTSFIEKHLCNEKKRLWNIYPFYGYGTWMKKNCQKCPNITNFLKSIPNLKLATLSKIDPYVTLSPHKGWANYSNNVIRCHFGIRVPKNKCFISVRNDDDEEEISYLEENKWTIFDDSKIHYSSNLSDKVRIVLIIDIERPKNIEIGASDLGDTKELIQFMNYLKENN